MRPFQQLPMPYPKDFDPSVEEPLFFYHNFVKHFIPDMIRMMDVGLCVDPVAVEDLRTTIHAVLKTVSDRLEANQLIKKYQNSRLPEAQAAHAEKATAALRTLDYYLKPYKPGDMLHRTWITNTYLIGIHRSDDCKEKWTVKELKQYNIFLKDPFLQSVIEKRLLTGNVYTGRAMKNLAQYKLDLWNRPREAKAQEPVDLDPFNPGSHKQCAEFFELMKVDPVAFSKDTGEASWGRKALEEVQHDTTNEEMLDVLETMIDYSYSAIIKNNFLKAFDSYTIDGVLHGNIKLFGAKSFRPTSNNPNLLNAPSSGSIYAKPLKRCFIAPRGKIIYAIDLAALEDRVMANLSGDINKGNVFLEGLDGHSLNACGYFASEIEKFMGPNVDNVEYVKLFYHLIEEQNHAELKGIRSKSKAPTFKLAYGGYPDAHKGGVITQEIFDNYHNVLYPGITDYRENYVLPITKQQGYIHLGLGCRMYSSNPDQAIRTLNNATVQFWSILTMIAINEFNYQVDKAGLDIHIKVISTIYDSIYIQLTKDPELIKWTNDTLVPIMCVQYLKEERVHNEASGEIGNNWAELHKIQNNASIDDINEVLKLL